MAGRSAAIPPKPLRARAAACCLAVLGLVASWLPPCPAPAHAQGALSALQTDVDQIARRARPSVVTVLAQRAVQRPGETEARTRSRVGSGVAIGPQRIVTVASLVLGAQRVVVRTSNGLVAEAIVKGADPISNVALLEVRTLKLPPLKFAGGAARVGDWVVSLGTTFRAQPTQSVGNVAYVHREPAYTLLQLTNTVYPGNSGAAAINTKGELVGIVEGELGQPEVADDGAGAERPAGAASFVMPAEVVKPVTAQFERDGRPHHGFLGVTTSALSVRSPRVEGKRTPIGALIEHIVPGSPADRAGLLPGDIIVAFRGERVEYPEQLARWVAGTAPGAAAEVVWAREEIGMNASIALGEAPPEPAGAWIASWLDEGETTAGTGRIAELERQIKRLSGELDRLKTTRPPGR